MTPSALPMPVLERAAQSFVEATAMPPFLFDLPVEEGRRTVDAAQDGEFPEPATQIEHLTISGGPTGSVSHGLSAAGCHRPAAGHAVHPRRRLGVR
jgi:acetyl esterase